MFSNLLRTTALRTAKAALLALGATAVAVPVLATDMASVQQSCAARNTGPFGFQCQGWVNVGLGLESVTFLGTVEGSPAGVYNGTGVFNSSMGSARQRLSGQAVFQDRSCAGQVRYRVWLVTPAGEVPLPDLEVDFVPVNNGRETLGTATAAPGVTGAGVPRMNCRLARMGGH
jgi:hypothetical protein